jgi:predicted O-methyltransferase YrrM
MDPRIRKQIDELESLRTQRDDHWQIPRLEGDVLYQIALASGARTIVEVGTSYGFSGLFWGAALRLTGGTLHTIDIDPRKVESSRATFERAGLAKVVVNHLGDARQVLPEIAGPIDLAFLDSGDKKSTRALFELVWSRVRPGGSVLTDNATTHRAELADFVAYVRALPGAASAEVPVGNGVEWTIKLPRA